jgi:hypothetical protein
MRIRNINIDLSRYGQEFEGKDLSSCRREMAKQIVKDNRSSSDNFYKIMEITTAAALVEGYDFIVVEKEQRQKEIITSIDRGVNIILDELQSDIKHYRELGCRFPQERDKSFLAVRTCLKYKKSLLKLKELFNED